MKKTGLIIFIILVIALFAILISNKNQRDQIRNNINEIKIENLRLLDADYVSILAQITSPDDKYTVAFVVTDEGNKNDYGDILVRNNASKTISKATTFNSSSDGFADSLKFTSLTRLHYVESIVNGTEVNVKEKELDVSKI